MSTLHAILTAANDFAALLPQADIPNPAPVQPPGTNGFVTIMGWVKWVALAVCVIGIIVAGALMAINSRRGEGGEHVKTFVAILVGVMVIGAATALVGFISGS